MELRDWLTFAALILWTTLTVQAAWLAVGSAHFAPTRSNGTLIAAVPTRDGLVIAADSRSTVGNHYCDSTYKLIEVPGPNPTVISVTGTGIVFSAPPPDGRDLCEWIKRAPRLMDVETFVRDHIRAHPDDVSDDGLVRLGTAALQPMRDLWNSSNAAARHGYVGNNFFSIVVASYDRNSNTALLGGVGTRYNPVTNVPEITDRGFFRFGQDDRGQGFEFGLWDYVRDHVRVEGRKFLKEYLEFRPDEHNVRDMSVDKAVGALTNLMEAAHSTTLISAPPAGIGGPTDVLLLGHDAAPTRLRWK